MRLWAIAAAAAQLAAPASAQQSTANRYQGRFTYPEQEICAAWAGPTPVAAMGGMDHSQMNMGRRRTMEGMDHSQMVPQVRKYFIAAEVKMWDYAPSGRDLAKDAEFPAAPTPPPGSVGDGHDHDHSIGRRALQMDHSMHGGGAHAHHSAGTWMANSRASPYRIGRHYLKFVFNEYTDHTFSTLKPRAADDKHLGMLGPTIRAEVGDTIQVVFRNHAPDGFPFSMHPHGVKYGKAHEGANYADGTDMTGDHIMPGQCAYSFVET